MRRCTTVSSLIPLATFLLLLTPGAFATTHLLTDDGLGAYPTIQDAVNAVAPGDTILLADGTYSGAGNFRLLDTSPCAPDNSVACGLVGALGTNCDAVSGVEEPVVIPTASLLHACFPNPFNPVTTIRYDVAQGGRTHLGVYDVAGREIRVLVDEFRPVGRYEVVWDGRDALGGRAASGVYFCVMQSGGQEQVRKMVLLK